MAGDTFYQTVVVEHLSILSVDVDVWNSVGDIECGHDVTIESVGLVDCNYFDDITIFGLWGRFQVKNTGEKSSSCRGLKDGAVAVGEMTYIVICN